MKKTEKKIKLLIEVIFDDVESLNMDDFLNDIRGVAEAEIVDIEVIEER